MSDLPTQNLVAARRAHPAWLLLASQRAPLVLACLKPLFETGAQEIPLDDARERLVQLLGEHANHPDFAISDDDYHALARRELRTWIRQGLLAERGGMVLATDALQVAFRFVSDLDQRVMTSTASRLATVQQKIEQLESDLNPDKHSRIRHLLGKITELQAELERVKAGGFEPLDEERAREEIREVYSLAMSLRNDFRRVEDSYRDADRQLRGSLISEQHHRGQVLDQLLDTNDSLLATAEGRVFDGFHRQMSQSTDLDQMRARLRSILAASVAGRALDREQSADLRLLIQRLLEESGHVMRARARSERDVRGFIKSGLANEHHRVGQLLQQIFDTALKLDWSQSAVRRVASPLPPLAPAQASLPVPGRLCFKSLEDAAETTLNLEQQQGSLDALEQSLRETDDELDREALYRATMELLRSDGLPRTLATLARSLPPRYDLESLVYWLTLARETEAAETGPPETVDLPKDDTDEPGFRFTVPRVALDPAHLQHIAADELE